MKLYKTRGGGGGSKAVYKLYKKQEKWYVVPSLNHGSILISINTQMDM